MMSFHIIKESCVPSTNTAMKALAREGAPEGTVLLADRQTAGYGRHARAFFSPEHTGLYMSVLLRPTFDARAATLITPLAAVAAANAIEDVSNVRAEIKWVNDIYVARKKAAGILTEAATDARGVLTYAVLGVGINLFAPKEGFPPTLSHATAIFDDGRKEAFFVLRDALCSAFLSRFFAGYEKLPTAAFMEEYRRRSLLIGRDVTVYSAAIDPQRAGKGRRATVLDITEQGELLVRYEDGSMQALLSGEVTLGTEGL